MTSFDSTFTNDNSNNNNSLRKKIVVGGALALLLGVATYSSNGSDRAKTINLLALDIPNLMAVPQSGKATTTRYWDCQGGACGCGFGSSAKNTFCHSNALRKAPAGNKYGAQFYGSAAISNAMGGGDWQAQGCGKCWKLTATKNDDGSKASGTIVVKGTNYCPQSSNIKWCGGTKKHFDIAAPGFDTASGANHDCGRLEPGEPALSAQPCDCGKLKSKVLQRGCEHFKTLNWDNAHVNFELVTCPAELTIACDPSGVWPKKSPPTCSIQAFWSLRVLSN